MIAKSFKKPSQLNCTTQSYDLFLSPSSEMTNKQKWNRERAKVPFASVLQLYLHTYKSMADMWLTENSLPPGFLSSKCGKDEWKEKVTAEKGTREEWRCRQLHYLLTIGIIHIHPPAALPNQGFRERGTRLHRGVREMDVLRGDKEWRDKGSNKRCR